MIATLPLVLCPHDWRPAEGARRDATMCTVFLWINPFAGGTKMIYPMLPPTVPFLSSSAPAAIAGLLRTFFQRMREHTGRLRCLVP